MSASTTTMTTPTSPRHKSRKGGRGRGGHANRTGRRNSENRPTPTTDDTAAPTDTAQAPTDTPTNDVPTAPADDAPVCWICAEPVKYYSLSACNHRTCHVCALRLRALYKKLECTFCKEPQSTVIFTTSPDADFASYTPDAIPYKDHKLAIFFEKQDMQEETLILLRFNCPDPDCEYYSSSGWGDLKLHTRAMHGKVLCDLCVRSKKVFAHEHALYPPHILPLHLPSVPHRPSKQPPKEPVEGGVHPLCEFCRECFFGDDELFVHMRERHEECFICKRNNVRDQYFENYEHLEYHFSQAHFACTNTNCQAQKFVVFDSELDLKAHQVEVHGADMSSKDRKDARRVQAEFEFDDAGGGGRRGRRDRGDREREREPPPQVMQPQNRMGGRRREAFGGLLTTEGTQTAQPTIPPLPPSPIREDVDPLIVERHAAFLTRLQAIAPNPNNAVTAVKAAMRGYRANESSARDLISTVWNILDHDLDDTASIINAAVDLLEEEEKKRDLLAAWNGFKIEQRQQFPDLVPTAVGSGYAGIASGRILNAKHATSRSSQQSSRQVWDRVAQAASASSSRIVPGASAPPSTSSSAVHVDRFPRLAGPSSTVPVPVPVPIPTTPAFRQPQRQTPWTASARGPGALSTAVAPATPGPIALKKLGKVPPSLSSAAAFPELPAAAKSKAMKPPVSGNASLRNILGETPPPPMSAWKANGDGGEVDMAHVNEVQVETVGGKGKKGKGKQKQTLFTLGSFPT